MAVSNRSSSRAQLLAALGELVPFEPCDFVGELLDDCLIAVDLFAHRIDLRDQLRGQCYSTVIAPAASTRCQSNPSTKA